MGAQGRADFRVFLGRNIDADDPIDARLGALRGKPFGPARHHRIGIAHQHQRHFRMPRAKIARDAENVGGARSGGKRAQIGGLNRGAIGHRIGKGHAQFDHIRPARDQRIKDGGRGVRRGIPPGDEGDKGRAAFGEGSGEALGHN